MEVIEPAEVKKAGVLKKVCTSLSPLPPLTA